MMDKENISQQTMLPPTDVLVVQGSSAPVFTGGGRESLKCKCGNVLIEGFDTREFTGFYIRCYSCGDLSFTALWPDDEPLPQTTLNLGSKGQYRLDSAVATHGKVVITTQAEIDRLRQLNGRGNLRNFLIGIGPDGITGLKEMFDEVGGEVFRRALGQTKRRLSGQNSMEKPLAWAYLRIESAARRLHIDLTTEDGVALAYLLIAHQCIDDWRGQPMFAYFARGIFNNEFLHAVTGLVMASHLRRFGNAVGFTDTHRHERKGEQSPDLYLNITAQDRLSIEIKTPEPFQWPASPRSMEQTVNVIEKQVKLAKKQLTGTQGGIVVIGTSIAHADWARQVKEAIRILISSNRISRRIAAVGAVCINTVSARELSSLSVGSEVASIFAIPNLAYDGDAKINTSDSPGRIQ